MNAPQPGADTRPLAGPRVSVLVELDNLKRTRLERVHEALRALGREIAALDDPAIEAACSRVRVGPLSASPLERSPRRGSSAWRSAASARRSSRPPR